MTVSPTLHCVVLDCRDPYELARFYARLLGWAIEDRATPGDDWVVLVNPDGGADLAFQLDPEHQPSTWPSRERAQMLHLDLEVADLDEGHRHAVEVGARPLDTAPETFRVYADPAGHPFCLVRGT
ncbi:VOC family protein [Saccharomonospora saliphila]|uniref:VOC family protein n=1 Tax=Saccharomonospora saliphila TaxID=369829 RepID=UPI00037E152C|nr:VOC family protein [Saccharomonospora saliphila]